MLAVGFVATAWSVAYLWLNVVGAVVVTVVGLAVSVATGGGRPRTLAATAVPDPR